MFHGNNLKGLHSNLQTQTGNCSKGDHDPALISLSEVACVDSSAHILDLLIQKDTCTSYKSRKKKYPLHLQCVRKCTFFDVSTQD